MKKILSVSFILIGACGICLAGQMTEESYKIEPGDMLDIGVYQEEDLSGSFEVKEDGTISYPLLGSVNLKALSKSEAESRLSELLAADYLVEPHVRIAINKYHGRTFVVLGSVNKPGSYEFPSDGNVTLLEAVSMAGGYNRYASVSGIRIIRESANATKETIDPKINDIINGHSEDVELKPNDVVMVPERMF